jgi:ORF6N domain
MSKTDVALIEQRIYTIRGVRIILDSDLAALYGVHTKRLNEHNTVATESDSRRISRSNLLLGRPTL